MRKKGKKQAKNQPLEAKPVCVLDWMFHSSVLALISATIYRVLVELHKL